MKKRKIVLIVIVVIGLILTGLFLHISGKYQSQLKLLNPVASGMLFNDVFAIKDSISNVYIVKVDDTTYFAIDAGLNKNNILKEMQKCSITPEFVRKVFLTHSDFDHVNGIAAFSKAQVYMHEQEADMLFRSINRAPFVKNKVSVKYSCVRDNEKVSVGEYTVRAINQEGHTPGHCAYLVNDTYLFTGDAIQIENGKAQVHIPLFNMDTKQLIESNKRLKKYSYVKAVFTAHFGYSTTPQELFSKLE
ncbi:MAG TPA: MBL fold metallo-hydrolase [Chitinispirillaceae bacterium]|nr:MBL fold metallo-hydrolase [Chitinispirillaceae bacterium]